MSNTNIDIEAMKMSLTAQRIDDFLSTLDNEEDLNATKENLSCLLSKAIVRLHVLEKQFLMHLITDSGDSICPCCLASYTKDVVNTEALADAFNRYLGDPSEDPHD